MKKHYQLRLHDLGTDNSWGCREVFKTKREAFDEAASLNELIKRTSCYGKLHYSVWEVEFDSLTNEWVEVIPAIDNRKKGK